MQLVYDIAPGGDDIPCMLMKQGYDDDRLWISRHFLRAYVIPGEPNWGSSDEFTRIWASPDPLYLDWRVRTQVYDNKVYSAGSLPVFDDSPQLVIEFKGNFWKDDIGPTDFTATISGRISQGGSYTLWMQVKNYATGLYEWGEAGPLVEPIANNWKSFRIRVPNNPNYFNNGRPTIRVSVKANGPAHWKFQIDHMRFDR